MVKHFESNLRLRWVFRICKSLGVDDPCYWMENVSPLVVDQWIAFEIHSANSAVPDKTMDPNDAVGILNTLGGT